MRHWIPLLTASVLAACSTVPRGEDGWAFPGTFAATQVVTITDERGETALLASVWREPGRFEIAFLDPALQVPVVSAALIDRGFSEERFVEFPLAPAAVEALLRDVDALYESRGHRPGAPEGAIRVGRWVVTLTRPSVKWVCEFPEQISLRWNERAVPRIEVRTLDVRCDARRHAQSVQ